MVLEDIYPRRVSGLLPPDIASISGSLPTVSSLCVSREHAPGQPRLGKTPTERSNLKVSSNSSLDDLREYQSANMYLMTTAFNNKLNHRWKSGILYLYSFSLCQAYKIVGI